MTPDDAITYAGAVIMTGFGLIVCSFGLLLLLSAVDYVIDIIRSLR